MAAEYQSAVITGGASGMGLAVANALAARGGWHIHLLDLHADRGKQAAADLPHATFHQLNICDYDALASVFQAAFTADKRLDFVFANAGIVERFSFYDAHPPGKPPPPPDLSVVDINLKAVINTAWLAQHYFRQSPPHSDRNLVMTASVGGFYRCMASPSYCGAKHGVVGLMRSIAPFFYKNDGIRVNAICPGTVKTNLLDASAWATFKEDVFVPIEKIVEAVLMLVDGDDVEGRRVGDGRLLSECRETAINNGGMNGEIKGKEEKLWGQAVELSGTKHYYRDQIGFCDDHMALCMKQTERETYNE